MAYFNDLLEAFGFVFHSSCYHLCVFSLIGISKKMTLEYTTDKESETNVKMAATSGHTECNQIYPEVQKDIIGS